MRLKQKDISHIECGINVQNWNIIQKIKNANIAKSMNVLQMGAQTHAKIKNFVKNV